MFREDFVWGVASSAYQVEGTDAADGRGACVWDMFAADGRVFEHQNADTSCDEKIERLLPPQSVPVTDRRLK